MVPLAAPVSAAEAETERPVVLTTDAQLDRAVDRVATAEEPFYGSWVKTLAQADAALPKAYTPQQSNNHVTYFGLGKTHAQDVRALVIAYRVTGNEAYATKARSILLAWAANAAVSPPPAAGAPHAAGLVVGRVMTTFADGYAMLYPELSAADRAAIAPWFEDSIEEIRDSRLIWETADELCDYGAPCTSWLSPWLNQQEFNNHLGAQNMGLMALGYALQDESVIRESIDSPDNPRNLEALVDGVIVMTNAELYNDDPTLTEGAPDVQPGEIYDRYRTGEGHGLHYSHIALRFIALQAEMVANNTDGSDEVDWFAHVGPNGENIALPFAFYSEFLLTGDATARGGYYAASAVDYSLLPLYELGHSRYPSQAEARTVLESFDRVANDTETFAWSLALTHGSSGLEISDEAYPSSGRSSWTFDEPDGLRGWTLRNVDIALVDGAAQLTLKHRDPGLVSPPLLGLPAASFEAFEFTIRNGAIPSSSAPGSPDRGDYAQLFWATDADRVFSAPKSVMIPVLVDDAEFHTYRVDLTDIPQWTGRIFQLRFDPTQGPTQGTVDIDSMRFIPVDANATGAPATGVLSTNSGHAAGLHGGTHSVKMDLWWGNNASEVIISENGSVVASTYLDAASPAAQSVTFDLPDRGNGTYEYTCELRNSLGSTPCSPVTVTVTAAAPNTPVLSHNNWDRDGSFTVSMNMWWGTNGSSYRLYENDVLVDEQSLSPNTPSAQSAATPLEGRAAGTHSYRAELIGPHGVTSSAVISVTVAP